MKNLNSVCFSALFLIAACGCSESLHALDPDSPDVPAADGGGKESFEQISLTSLDGLEMTADLYRSNPSRSTPLIVLCHQAGWSRGEYREIAPILNQMGFNCLAIDQRSGQGVNAVVNQTAKRAKAAGKSMTYADAEQDMLAAIGYARENLASETLILWGSSYSAALTLRIAGQHPELVDAAIAFAPGEYFASLGKPRDWIEQSSAKISSPVFITSAKNERQAWSAIFDAINVDSKTSYLPKTAGNHGSRALWKQFSDSQGYWNAVKPFLVSVAPQVGSDKSSF